MSDKRAGYKVYSVEFINIAGERMVITSDLVEAIHPISDTAFKIHYSDNKIDECYGVPFVLTWEPAKKVTE
ncbi:hypothetical protein [Listeria booriae]|uniref:Uncharacterized protein n=1 Tax=Listeria booriae TaxID=1552123 RepID=A0A7X0WDG1_9LIST|nr:hypothetical protein [Listeria booriae]MBC1331077.1 hypothetical protein [Listeria booriae]MBC2386388.1 hypothetical protein [Listeria booriae]